MTGRERASAAAVLSAMALVVLDAGLLNVALPTIAASLGETPANTVLAVSAYQTALVIGLLPCAQLAERIGYRRLFVSGLALFMVASILCALATSLPALVAARLVQGLGGSAIMALGIAMLRHAFGSDRLGLAISWNALTVALCSAAGPVLGASILAGAPWPWLFLIKLPIGMGALAASFALPRVLPTRSSVDVSAMLLHAAVAALVLIAAEFAVAKPIAAVLLAGGAVVLALILIRRSGSRPAPLWPIDLLALRPFRISVAASICCFTGQSVGLLALPFYLQLGLGQGQASTGLVLTCWPLTVALAGPLANRLAQRYGSAVLCVTGGGVLAIGLLSLAAPWSSDANVAPLAVGAALSGFGFGLFQVPNNRTMFLSAPVARSAAAGGLQGSARLIGQTLGALAMGILFAIAPMTTAVRAGFALASLFAIASALISALEMPARVRRVPAQTPF